MLFVADIETEALFVGINIFRSRCRHSCSLQLRVGCKADSTKMGHRFLFRADSDAQIYF